MNKIRKIPVDERERKAKENCKEIKVEDTDYFYWVCDKCDIAFLKGDTILVDQGLYKRCPLMNRRLFSSGKICRNQLYGGFKDSFNTYYEIL